MEPIIENQYGVKIDSISNYLNVRIDTVHERGDSVYKSIASLQSNIDSVTNNNMKELHHIYNKHTHNHIRQGEIDTLWDKSATVADRFTTKVTELGTSIDSLNDEFNKHTK